MDKSMTLAAARKKYHSDYHIAKVLEISRSNICKWGKYVPEHHVPTLLANPGGKLKRGGKR